MRHIIEAILNHLEMKTTGALLLTGDWGSGKTYHVKNYIFPEIEKQNEFIPIIVSLYGETDKNNIAQKVLFAFFDKKGKGSNLSTGTIARNIKNFTDAIPIVKNYIDVEKLIVGTGDNIFKLLPHDKLLICFDDIERMSREVNIDDFLGIVNELVENRGTKVILIADEEKIPNGISFKEKTIEKTIHFSPDISRVLDNITESYEDPTFKRFLVENKDFILLTLKPKIKDEKEGKVLKKSFSNIRTIKFSIEHFKHFFSFFAEADNFADDLIQKQLRNVWLFCLTVSTEFRKPNNISFNDKKNLDKQRTSFLDIDISHLAFETDVQTDEETQENEWAYSNKVKSTYYNHISEDYIFYPEVYDFITSGKAVSKDSFLSHLEQSFNVKEGKVNPAHELSNKFMHRWWSFSNQEFQAKIKELLEYVSKGEFDDILSYLNAGAFLLRFVDLYNSTEEEVVKKIKIGIDKYLIKNEAYYRVVDELDMVSDSFTEENLKSIISYTRGKILEIEKVQDEQEAKELEKLFHDDLISFVESLRPESSSFRTPDKPIFHKFNEDVVKDAVKSWEPKEIMEFDSLLRVRYLGTGFSNELIEELSFLDSIEAGIAEIDLNNKSLSNHIIKTRLNAIINKSKIMLEDHKARQSNL